ncbi:MAG: cupin domain-containing protein [Haliea sp.]
MSTSTITLLLVTVFAVAGMSPGLAADSERYRGDGHMFLVPEDLQWGPVASMGDGALIAFIEGDTAEEEPFTFRLKLEDGYAILPHIHPAYERVTVLSGTLHFAHGEVFERSATTALEPGAVAIMPPGDPMYGYAEGETVIQLHGTGPWGIQYINPEDDPRRQ